MSGEIEQIKERIGVAELIGEYLKLEKAGSNYKGLCPFHNEKTPSFMVNPERNFWYCFGCQKGGDIFSFVQEIEGINFSEALHRLADKAGVELPKFSAVSKQQRSEKDKLFEILKLAAQYYQYQLGNNPQKDKILDYLHRRGISSIQISQFHIGYAPAGWSNLLNFLLKKGYFIGDVFKTGLLVQKNQNQGNLAEGYDRFRDRIMFPIIDAMGNVVGFSARVAPGGDEKNAKYINTPETPVYDKSATLYGLFQSKVAIRSANSVIVVEGNIDVIASHCAGVGNVVAVSGTALTQKHVQLIKRYTQNVKLCFDMDEAGQKAAQKSIRTCLLGGLEVEAVLLPEGFKDVSDLVEKNPKLWQETAKNSIPVMDFYFKSVAKKHDLEKVSGKKMAAKELLNIIKDVADPIEQSYWLKKLSALIQIEEEVLTGVLEKATVEKNREQQHPKTEVQDGASNKQFKKTRKVVLEESILGLFFLHRKELEPLSSRLDRNLLDENFLKIWQDMLEGRQDVHAKQLETFSLDVQYRKDDKEGFVENEFEPLKEWEKLLFQLDLEAKRQKQRRIMLDIKRAEEAGEEDVVDLLIREFNKLQKDPKN